MFAVLFDFSLFLLFLSLIFKDFSIDCSDSFENFFKLSLFLVFFAIFSHTFFENIKFSVKFSRFCSVFAMLRGLCVIVASQFLSFCVKLAPFLEKFAFFSETSAFFWKSLCFVDKLSDKTELFMRVLLSFLEEIAKIQRKIAEIQ